MLPYDGFSLINWQICVASLSASNPCRPETTGWSRVMMQSTKEAREATQKLGLELLERPVASVEELRNALQAFRSGDADAYLAAADAMLDGEARSVI